MGLKPLICESIHEALPALDALEEGILVAPLNGGLELLSRLRALDRTLPCLLLSDEPDPDLQTRLRAHGAWLCKSHPGQLAERIRLIDSMHYQLRFRFTAIGLFDLVQLLAKSGISTMLQLMDDQDLNQGVLCFEQGRILHAVSGSLVGEAAFFKLMSLPAGRFLSAQFGQLECFSITSELPRLIARSALQMVDISHQRFAGLLSQLNLFDLLEVLGMGTTDYRLACLDAFSSQSGDIYIGRGRIWHANFGDLTGVDALTACLQLRIAQISILEADIPEYANLCQPVGQLLMPLALQQDQAKGQQSWPLEVRS